MSKHFTTHAKLNIPNRQFVPWHQAYAWRGISAWVSSAGSERSPFNVVHFTEQRLAFLEEDGSH